jgi:hypothetical protein
MMDDPFYLNVVKFLSNMPESDSWIKIAELANDIEGFIARAKTAMDVYRWPNVEFNSDYTAIRKFVFPQAKPSPYAEYFKSRGL